MGNGRRVRLPTIPAAITGTAGAAVKGLRSLSEAREWRDRVFIVPQPMTLEEWSAVAAKQQAELVETARRLADHYSPTGE